MKRQGSLSQLWTATPRFQIQNWIAVVEGIFHSRRIMNYPQKGVACMEQSRAKQIVNEARALEFAGRNHALAEGQQIHAELDNLNPNIEMDAKEFGEHVRNGGWRLGLLVARSVALGEGEGRPSKTAQNSAVSKISSRSFARQAGNISANTVTKYFNAWNLAAVDGYVPDSDVLGPGESYHFDNENHTPEVWKKYFKTPGSDDTKNTFIALKNKLDSFETALDFDLAFDDFDNQFDVSLDNFLESLERVQQKINEGRTKAIALAEKNEFRVEYH